MARRIRSVSVAFNGDELEFKVSYTHDGAIPSPGTKGRENDAKRMILHALEHARSVLEEGGDVAWGGHSEGRQTATDSLIAG